MTANSTGNCYLCGASLSKSAMRNHLFKLHGEDKGGQGNVGGDSHFFWGASKRKETTAGSGNNMAYDGTKKPPTASGAWDN